MGALIVISSPSGGGKGTLIPLARKCLPPFGLTTSHTTRDPRPGEEHGREYFFVDVMTFRQMAAKHLFVEHAVVHRNLYGTSYAELERVLASGENMLLEIDIQGALQVKAKYPEAHLIFILPPSMEELERRLRARGTESESEILRRLETAPKEIDTGLKAFDFLTENKDLEEAVAELVKVIEQCISPRVST